MACDRIYGENSAWSGEALVTQGFEVRYGGNVGPLGSADQDLVTQGWSQPRPILDGGLTVLDLYGVARLLTERSGRLFDSMRGLSDGALSDLVDDLSTIPWIGNHAGSPRDVAQYLCVSDLQRKISGGGPRVIGTVSSPFTFPDPPPFLKAIIRVTIGGITRPDVGVEFQVGPSGARDVSAFYTASFFNNSNPFRSVGLEAFISPDDRVSLRIKAEPKGQANSIEIVSVIDPVYGILGWTPGVYRGVDPISSLEDLCETVIPDLLPILTAHEAVRTVEITA
jgi:hypothetical protein